jgi:hypothetical protein
MRRRWVRIANQRERNGGHPGLRIPKSCACGRRLAMLLSPFNRTLIQQRFARLFGIPSRSSRPVAIPAPWPMLSQNLYLSGQCSKTRLSIDRKGFRSSAIPFRDTMSRLVPNGTPPIYERHSEAICFFATSNALALIPAPLPNQMNFNCCPGLRLVGPWSISSATPL